MTPVWPSDAGTRLARRLIRAAGALVRGELRGERVSEWEGELWHLRTGPRRFFDVPWFVAGVWWDAIHEAGEGWRMELIVQDIRFALRTLMRSPGFTAASVLTLALSIGASTAMFSVVKEAVLTKPPYPDPDRLVVVDMLFGMPETEMNVSVWSYPRFAALRDDVSAVEGLAGYEARSMTLTELGDPSVVSVEVATPSLFDLLGVTAQRGRLFGAEAEYDGDADMVAVVSDAFWATRMGRDPDVVGTVITLDRLRFTVIGVASADYEGVSGDAEVWLPMSSLREIVEPSMLEDAWNQHFFAVGRLADGVDIARAQEQVAAFGATVMDRFPPPVGAQRLVAGARVVTFEEARTNPAAATSMMALLAAVLLVLLIATANLAGLLLARGASRQHEAAVRASLGAGRTRLLRQLLTESLTLAALGGSVGLLFASSGIDLLGTWLTESIGTDSARGLEYVAPEALSLDWRVFAFGLLLTAGVGLAFGMLPAWQVARTDPASWLKGGRGAIGSRRRLLGLGSRDLLVGGQVALAVVLLSAASLMMRTSLALQRVDLGFDAERLLTATYALTPVDEQAGIEPGVFHVELVDRIRGLPGVVDAGVGEVPMGGPTQHGIVLGSDGNPDLNPNQHFWIRTQAVSDGFLTMMGADFVEGRDIERTDEWNTEKVVVLGRSAADELFPDGAAIGRRIQLSRSGYGSPGATVVGIVEDMQFGRPDAPLERLAFLSVRQSPPLATGLLVRTSGAPDELIPAVRSTMAELAPQVALTSTMSMDARAASTTVRARVLSMLLGFFGLVALFLVAVGLYASVAYAVTQRTRELGLRASLGAGRTNLLALVARQGMGVSAAGVVVGVLGAWWTTRFLRDLVFGIEGVDATGLVAVCIVLAGVALVATWLPARRGMRIDPMVALRQE